MNFHHAEKKTLLVAFAATVILGVAASDSYRIVSGKAEEQTAALKQINRWKQEYELLKPYQQQWTTSIPSLATITDLYQVNQALQLEEYQLDTDQERLIVDKIEPMMPNGTNIGANKLCLKTAGENGFAITAKRFSPDLLNGLQELANRRDIEMQNITLTTTNASPKAVLDFCLIIRD